MKFAVKNLNIILLSIIGVIALLFVINYFFYQRPQTADREINKTIEDLERKLGGGDNSSTGGYNFSKDY